MSIVDFCVLKQTPNAVAIGHCSGGPFRRQWLFCVFVSWKDVRLETRPGGRFFQICFSVFTPRKRCETMNPCLTVFIGARQPLAFVSLPRQCFVFFLRSLRDVTNFPETTYINNVQPNFSLCEEEFPNLPRLLRFEFGFVLRWFCSYGYRDPMGLFFFLLLQLNSIRIEWPNSKKSKVKVCFVFVCICTLQLLVNW